MGPSWGQYGSHVVGGIYVHSVACGEKNDHNLPVGEYLRLGNPASHGCIRCCVADAKWVFDNCNGSEIKIYDGIYKSDEASKDLSEEKPLHHFVELRTLTRQIRHITNKIQGALPEEGAFQEEKKI